MQHSPISVSHLRPFLTVSSGAAIFSCGSLIFHSSWSIDLVVTLARRQLNRIEGSRSSEWKIKLPTSFLFSAHARWGTRWRRGWHRWSGSRDVEGLTAKLCPLDDGNLRWPEQGKGWRLAPMVVVVAVRLKVLARERAVGGGAGAEGVEEPGNLPWHMTRTPALRSLCFASWYLVNAGLHIQMIREGMLDCIGDPGSGGRSQECWDCATHFHNIFYHALLLSISKWHKNNAHRALTGTSRDMGYTIATFTSVFVCLFFLFVAFLFFC